MLENSCFSIVFVYLYQKNLVFKLYGFRFSKCKTHHFRGEFRMYIVTENVPPELKILCHVAVSAGDLNLFRVWIEVLQPRLNIADEMQDFHIFTESIR